MADRKPNEEGDRIPSAATGQSKTYSAVPLYRRRTFQVVLLAVFLVLVAVFVGILAFNNEGHQARLVKHDTDRISVRGRVGSTPVVDVLDKVPDGLNQVSELTAGEGREVYESSPVLLALYPFSAEDGKPLTNTGKPTFRVGTATAEDLGNVLFEAVKGRKEGSRLLIVHSKENQPPELIVVDILPTQANGAEVAPEESQGALEVNMTDYGPVINHGDIPPSELTVQVLRKGTGAQIHAGDSVIAQYLALKWSNKEVIDSTWTNGIPARIDLDSVMPGLKEAMLDQRVGTRLAVSIPPDAATGEDTVVVLVDILALAN